MSVLKDVEEIDFRVVRIATDDARTNTALFEKLTEKSDCPFVVPHPLDPSRLLFLSYDYTHLAKNIRNLWIDKDFKINGNPANFSPVVNLYKLGEKEELKPVRNLVRKAIQPTNLERQKVKYALLVFSVPVIAAIKMFAATNTPGFENTQDTV